MNARDRIEHRISDDELARRWREVRIEMAARELDAIVMQSQNDWLGGYVRWFADLPATNGYDGVCFPAAKKQPTSLAFIPPRIFSKRKNAPPERSVPICHE